MTSALRMMGLHQLAQFNVFHHVLSRARWSPLQMSRVLFLLLVRTFVPAGAPIQLVVDETNVPALLPTYAQMQRLS